MLSSKEEILPTTTSCTATTRTTIGNKTRTTREFSTCSYMIPSYIFISHKKKKDEKNKPGHFSCCVNGEEEEEERDGGREGGEREGERGRDGMRVARC